MAELEKAVEEFQKAWGMPIELQKYEEQDDIPCFRPDILTEEIRLRTDGQMSQDGTTIVAQKKGGAATYAVWYVYNTKATSQQERFVFAVKPGVTPSVLHQAAQDALEGMFSGSYLPEI